MEGEIKDMDKGRLKELIAEHDTLNEKVNEAGFQYVQKLPEYKRVLEIREEIGSMLVESINNEDLKKHATEHAAEILANSALKIKTPEEIAKEFLSDE